MEEIFDEYEELLKEEIQNACRKMSESACRKKKIGLFFGSFNPVHIGHMIIANYMVTQTDLDNVWLVVSPQNPLKPKNTLARDFDRLHLVRLAIGDNPKIESFEHRI